MATRGALRSPKPPPREPPDQELRLPEESMDPRISGPRMPRPRKRGSMKIKNMMKNAIPPIPPPDEPRLSSRTLRETRITSYNVCYTKLLRAAKDRGGDRRSRG